MTRWTLAEIDRPFWAAVAVVLLSGVAALVTLNTNDGRGSAHPSSIPGATQDAGVRASSLPFDLDRPDWTLALPASLREISGLAVEPDGRVGWAVNDELGRLYKLDLVDGHVTPGPEFAGRGDYEGIEVVGRMIVASRSDGTLFIVGEGTSGRVRSPLSKAYDVEGLAHDARRNRLLVACKGKAGKKKALRRARAIYAVKLPGFEWEHEPAIVVERDALRAFIREYGSGGLEPGRAKHFAPSGVAVEPESDHVYVISTTGRMLVVLHPTGRLMAAAPLRRELHPQPEGLAFDAEGSLYIASEGRDSGAVLFRFDRKGSYDGER